jgi:hypothetical protein
MAVACLCTLKNIYSCAMGLCCQQKKTGMSLLQIHLILELLEVEKQVFSMLGRYTVVGTVTNNKM